MSLPEKVESLAALLVHQFAADVRRRGKAYYYDGRVEIVEDEPGFVVAEVTGSQVYDVALRWSEASGSWDVACNCPAFEEWNPCKHLWAVILTMDDLRLGLPPVRDEHGPSARAAAPRAHPDARRAGRQPAEAPAWRARLDELHHAVESASRDPWPRGAREDFRVVYVIGFDASREDKGLPVRTLLEKRLKNGGWGVRKPYHHDHGDTRVSTDPLDLLILGNLSAQPGEDYFRWSASRSHPIGWLNNAQRELLLPMLCSTGRFHWKDATEPLVWDDGEPWVPSFAVRRDEERRECVLEGSFTRGGEKMPLTEPVLIFSTGHLITQRVVARFDASGAMDLVALMHGSGPIRAPIAHEEELLATLLESPGTPRIDARDVAPASAAAPRPHLTVKNPRPGIGRDDALDCWISFDYGGVLVSARDPKGIVKKRTETEFVPGARPELVRRDFAAEAAALRRFVECGGEPDFESGPVGNSSRDEFISEAPLDTLTGTTRERSGGSMRDRFGMSMLDAMLGDEFEPETPSRELRGVPTGAQRSLSSSGSSRDATIEVKKLPSLVKQLIASGWTVDAQGHRFRSAGAFNLSVRSGIDWFDLEGGLDFEGQTASMPALIAAARRGADTVQLGDGSVGILPERWMQDWGLLEAVGDAKGERVRFKRNQGWILDVLLAAQPDIAIDATFAAVRAKLASFQGIAPKHEPESFHGSLRAYQREGLGWFDFLREMGFGGCLADDMGLGKTVQVLALLEELRAQGVRARAALPKTDRAQSGVRQPSLVVAPKSLTFNWIAEARRFAPELKLLDYTGIDRKKSAPRFDKHDLVITTYGTLRQDIVALKEQRFHYAILDESQAIKNAQSQAAKAARLLVADHRLALSGTPIENHLGELWSLFEFLNPGMLGRAGAFKSLMAGKNEMTLDKEGRALLSRALRPFFLRRTKEQVLPDLPEKIEQELHCDLEPRQRREYNELREHYRRALLGEIDEASFDGSKFQVLEALLRLRQAACHPGLIDKSRAHESSAKIDALLPLLEEVIESGHKALVFSQFTSLLAIVRKKIDDRGWTYEYLDGKTRDRETRVQRFQTDANCPLFLISLKAGGFGLNLTAADYVFLLDPWWNPAVETQAIDRTHRIGQTRSVMAYRLIASDTVEERVLELQEKKRDLAEAILSDDNALLRDLTREDLQQLLS